MYILNLTTLTDVERNIGITFLIVGISILVFIALIVGMVIAMHVHQRNDSVLRLRMFKSDRVFIVNYQEQTVDCFDLNDLRKIETISFLDFLNFFPDSEQNSVRTFIISLLNLNFNELNEDSILVTNFSLYSNKKRFLYRGILQTREVDKEKQIVYLEASRLTHTPVEHRNNKKNAKHDIYEVGIIKKMYDDGRFNKGTMHVFRFFLKPNTVSYVNEYILRLFLIDMIYSITNNNISYFSFTGGTLEFSVLDLRTFNDYQMSKFVFDMVHTIDRFLEIKGLNSYYDYSVCSSQVSDLPLYFDAAYAALQELQKNAKQINRKLSTYKAGISDSSIIESTYKIEVNRIIKDKDFAIKFSPIVHVTNSRVSIPAYISIIKFNSSLISTNTEVYRYANEFGLNTELMPLILRKVIPPFISQCSSLGNTKLAFEISINDLNNVVKIISHIAKSNTIKVILMIRSLEMIDLEGNINIENQIKVLKEKGYNFGLLVKQGDYILKDKTYKLFDYYFVDPALESNVKQDSRSYIKIESLFDKLRRLENPIIAINLASFQGVELLSKSGIKDFSSDAISKADFMLLPIDSKIHKKLLTMVK